MSERTALPTTLLDRWLAQPRWYQRAVCREVGAPSIDHATVEQLQRIETMLMGCHT